jgi:hypothetical protein
MHPIDEKLDTAQLEAGAASVVGQIIFVLSRLEYNIDLYLRNVVGHIDGDAVDPLLSRLSFKSKVDALRDLAEQKLSADDPRLSEFRQWHGTINKYRARRNAFVHGRWGTHYPEQQVINIASGQSTSKPSKETRYSLGDLEGELFKAKQIAAAFYKWCETWPLMGPNNSFKPKPLRGSA